MIDWLQKTERLLESLFERSSLGARSKVAPLDLVRQIQREIDRNRLPFINDQILVPHRMVIHLFAPSQAMVDEYEALFNTAEFREYIEKYIGDRGCKLLDRLRTVLHCHQERTPEFERSVCFIEFSWPQASTDPGEVTVALDSVYGRIKAVNAPESVLPVHASLEVLDGRVYRSPVEIRLTEFNIGRTENILQESSGKVIRTNHLAFARPELQDVINRSVSRRHATITWEGAQFCVHDCGSENGTRVERGRATIAVPRDALRADGIPLQSGDVIQVGRGRVRFNQEATTAK